MATDPPKVSTPLRTKRVLLRDRANATLDLDNQGRHEEALAAAIDLAADNQGVSLVHKLLGLLYQKKAARLGSDVPANSFRDKACAAFSEAARLAPKCLLTAIDHADALAGCKKYDEAYAELIRARDVPNTVDPGQSYVGYETEKFSIRDTTYSDRLATAREKLASAMERVQKHLHHRDLLSKAKEFWQNYPSKDTFTTVPVDELCDYHERLMPEETASNLSKSLRGACSFVKKHNQWGLLVWNDQEFMDISLLCEHMQITHAEAWPMLEAIVASKLSGPAEQIRRSFPDIKFTQDDQQRDILHLPSVEHVFAEMQVDPCAELPLELEIKAKKNSKAVEIFEGIVKAIKGFTEDADRAKVEEQIQSSWANFLETCCFDYREVVLPAATIFQWPYALHDKLKRCMDEAKALLNSVCSKCWESGHAMKDCNLCIVCGSTMHRTAHCPLPTEAKPLAHFVGYAVPGHEFFIANEPGSHHVTAHISVEAGTLSVDELVAEFFSQFDVAWDWRAKQLGYNSFFMKFPNLGKVEELSKSAIQLQNSGATIRVSKRASEPVPKAKLNRVWLGVNGVPEERKYYKSLCAIGSMVGAVVEVDMEALEEFDIVRIMMDVKDPNQFPLSKEYGVPPYLYDLHFNLESVVTVGGAYEEGTGDGLNSQDNRSYQNWSQTRPSSDASHQSGGTSSSTDIGRTHGTFTPDPLGRWSRLDFPGSSSKGPDYNGAEEAKMQSDFELAIRSQKKLEGRPRYPQDVVFSAEDIHENWEPTDEAVLEQIKQLMDDHKLAVRLQHKLNQDGEINPKAVFKKKKPPRTPGEVHVKPSVLNSYSELQTPHWLRREKKLCPSPLPKQVYMGKEISEEDVAKFALYCKAATNCQEEYTICHVCSFEGVSDRRILKLDMKSHFDDYHEQAGVSYECNVCETRARTSMDIRKHHHFAHVLPSDWWPDYIPCMDLW